MMVWHWLCFMSSISNFIKCNFIMKIGITDGASRSNKLNVFYPTFSSPWQPVSEVEIEDGATLTCNVATHKPCTVKVHLMFKGSGDKLTWPRLIPSSVCKISHDFTVYQQEFQKRFTSLWCIVENKNDKHTFLFRPWPSGNNSSNI